MYVCAYVSETQIVMSSLPEHRKVTLILWNNMQVGQKRQNYKQHKPENNLWQCAVQEVNI